MVREDRDEAQMEFMLDRGDACIDLPYILLS